MTVTRFADAPTIETPNATMRTLASPSHHHSALAVWQATLQPGASGPAHRMDADQVYVALAGSLTITIDEDREVAGVGDSIFVPGSALRQVANDGEIPLSFTVSMPAGAKVSTPSGSHHGELPWAR